MIKYFWTFFTGKGFGKGLLMLLGILSIGAKDDKSSLLGLILLITLFIFLTPIMLLVANTLGTFYYFEQDTIIEDMTTEERLRWANREGEYEEDEQLDWKAVSESKADQIKKHWEEETKIL